MSMITSITRLPGNWSRTSTQAISVPKIAFSRVTSSAAPTVSRSVLSASLEVTLVQNVENPSWNEVTTIAAIGSSTISESQSTPTPSPRPDVDVSRPEATLRGRLLGTGALPGAGPPAGGGDEVIVSGVFIASLSQDGDQA